MISIDPAVLAAIVSLLTLLAVIAGGVFWLGKLSNRVGNLEKRVDQLDAKVDDVAEDLRKEMREMRNEIREEMREMRSELLEEMRHGNQQLLLALVNHSHDAGGQPMFRVPVNPE